MNPELKILLLEDNPADAVLVQLMLRRNGLQFSAVVAGDEYEFLTAINSTTFDVVLADNALPQYSSLEALNIVREKSPYVAFILVTGTVSEEFAVHIIQLGADDYILKNNLTRLPAAISKAIERKRIQREKEMEKDLSDSIINSLPGVFYLIDKNGKYLRWNKNMERLSGYTAKEISEMRPEDFFNHDKKEYVTAWIKEVFTKGYSEIETVFISKNGEEIAFYFTGMATEFNEEECLIGIGFDITERILAEKQLIKINKELRNVSKHLEKIREEEQSRIAREVHDQLGQQITSMKLMLNRLKLLLSKNAEGKEQLQLTDQIALQMDETITIIRKIASDLRPPLLDDLGLVETLDWVSKEFMQKTGIEVKFSGPAEEIEFDPMVAIGLYRIYQEILTNVARHSEAKGVFTLIEVNENDITMTVTDDGKGFDSRKKHTSLGLLGMQERAHIIGGTIAIISQQGKGTRVKVRVREEGGK